MPARAGSSVTAKPSPKPTPAFSSSLNSEPLLPSREVQDLDGLPMPLVRFKEAYRAAGFEIENPRLNAETLPPGKFKEVTNPSYVDVRDDRIVLAFNALRKKQEGHRYYYVVRAVTPGAYQAPSATAECMYDASIRAASPMGRMEVKSRQ